MLETLGTGQGAQEMREVAGDNQARYVLSELAGIGSYMIAMGHRVAGPLDEAAFRAAAQALVQRHAALRTRFELSGGVVHAVVSPDAPFRYHACRMEDQSFAGFRDWALPLVFDDVDPRQPGALVRVLVADLGDAWRFTIAAHHAITDGFSRGVMTRELLKLYAGEDLPPVGSYYDYTDVETAEPDAARAVEALVQALPAPVRLIGDGVESGTEVSAGHVVERDFDDLSAPLRQTAKALGATRFGLLSAVYALGLHGFSGETAVSSFFQTEGRKSLGAPNSVVGPFSHTLPLDLQVDLDRDFAAFARALSDRTRAAVALENAPVLDAVLAAGKAPDVSINMFPPAPRIVAGALEIGPREFLDRRTEFDLNLVWSEDRRVLTARAFHDRAQLSEGRTRQFLDLQARLLAAALRDPERTCRSILAEARSGHESILPRETLAPEPARRIHADFFDHAGRTPDALAILTSHERISYRALADRARAVSAGLEAAGAGPQDRVAILGSRDPALVAAMLGVSAHGASFAVVDASYPEARIRHMLDRLGARFVIEAGARLPEGLAGLTCVEPRGGGTVRGGAPRAAACHLFTSGTTGAPKLITHPDATLQRFLAWQAGMLALPEPPVTMMLAGVAHDPTLRDVFLPLSNGGAVAIPTPCEMADPSELRALLGRAGCSVLRLGPASARLLTTGLDGSGGFETLRAVFWGGERLPRRVVAQWQEQFPHVRQFNIFGTTETPQAFLFHEIQPGEARQRDIPIGRALPFAGARLVAGDGTPVSAGEVGELVAELADPVGGARDPFADDPGAPARRHFTGDLAFQTPEGEICFAGRRDGQVKINGFRVELGEIEAAAEALAGVQQASAVLRGDRLRLFLLSEQGGITEPAVRSALARVLPAYMLPATILILPRFPATPNGKVDKDALVDMARDAEATIGGAGEAPRGALEQQIAALFARHSGRGQVHRDQALADLGADSLATIEARLELDGMGLTLPQDWAWRSVAELAAGGRQAIPAKATPMRLLRMTGIDSFILVRSLAIVTVVAFHTGLKLSLGASIVLFVFAGFSFGRLQLPAVLRADHAGRVWALLLRLIVPLVPFSLLYFAKNAFVEREAHPSMLLPYRNMAEFLDVAVLGRAPPAIQMEWLWFLHAYLQMFLAIALLLTLPAVRRALSQDIWRGLAAFFLTAEAVNLAVFLGVALRMGGVAEAAELVERLPTTILPFLAIGAMVATAATRKRQAVSLGIAIAHALLCLVLLESHTEPVWLFALALCLAFPSVALPRLLASLVVLLAAHSLMIYLTHPAANFLFGAVAGEGAYPVANILFQLGFGVAFGMVFRPILRAIGVNRVAEARITL
ncbi:Non-ribosomal peptide synthetase component F [Tropicimonas sediminicola]|uniref:Non-ribosomal peptide synthetase component F n=2 Tax=Tropicimonas sediminicola TaxID=1031541 RepID=A0A239K1Y4_9RHOB|nr:Non-ribosomal peptide synthetase component F [Tropicimonas sediminicola]